MLSVPTRHQQVVARATRHATPAAYRNADSASFGGLIGYGVDEDALPHQAAINVGRILKGARPADLSSGLQTTFKLVVNLNTAGALGLTVFAFLERADEIIQ